MRALAGWIGTVLLLGASVWVATLDGAGAMTALQRWTAWLPDGLWWRLTWLGDAQLALLAYLTAALLWQRNALTALLWAVLPATLLTHGLKALAAAPRPAAVLDPSELHVIGEVLRHGSFPSGHTITAFVLAGCWVLSAPPGWGRVVGWLLALPLAAAIGISRLAVGAHWPLDVVAGALVGWLCAAGAAAVARRSGSAPGSRLLFAVAGTLVLLAATLPWRALPADIVPMAAALGGLALGVVLAGGSTLGQRCVEDKHVR
ncbi:MAG: phosphatase PAP2 family protein [Tepidimonas sp.]|uniref:phosphatase PAP2 family protein n=1 Tax=Tepidimonas sp. TaxID=2002775 RepID=UPI00259E1039|nr:phosphatase PAP2 family protein [Tepidimonas sp.]MDM7456471.1 phosphatase PAP2 family protein [Tepidimonas sp.]